MKSEAFAPVNNDVTPTKATHGGTFALEPRPTVCHESAYIPRRSSARIGASGNAPPTICPNLSLEAKSAINVTRIEIERIGRLVSQEMGDGAFTNSISAFSSASSLRSRADGVMFTGS